MPRFITPLALLAVLLIGRTALGQPLPPSTTLETVISAQQANTQLLCQGAYFDVELLTGEGTELYNRLMTLIEQATTPEEATLKAVALMTGEKAYPTTHTFVIQGDSFANQMVVKANGLPDGPLVFFDGKRTHNLSGINLNQGEVVCRGTNQKVRDTTKQGSTGTHQTPVNIFLQSGNKWLWEDLKLGKCEVVPARPGTSEVDTVSVRGNLDGAETTLLLSRAKNYLPISIERDFGARRITCTAVQVHQEGQMFIPLSWVTIYYRNDHEPLVTFSRATKYHFGPQDNIFQGIAAAKVGRVYDMNTDRRYELNARLSNFNAEQGLSSRRIIGWVFLASVVTITLSIFLLLVRWQQKKAYSPS